MISVHFQGKPFNITVIQVYALASKAKRCPFHYRGLECKVGSEETPGVIGKLGLGIQNEAGQRLIKFCQQNALVIANTLFQQQKRRLYSWTSPDGQTKIRLIIFFAVKDGEVLYSQQKQDCGSDHELLIAKFRLN